MKKSEEEARTSHDIVRSSLFILFVLSSSVQAFYLVALPISIEADGAGYYSYARGIGGFDRAWFMWWRPPGYPLYLHILGMTWLDSFSGVLAANVLLGISMPLLLYGTLLPIGERWAFVATLLFIVSTVPFSYAKVITNDHSYSFCLLLTAFCFSRFVITQRWEYATLSTVAVLAALMIRNEAFSIAVIAVALQLSTALWWRDKTAVVSVFMSALIALNLIFAWSWVRSRVLNQPELFGSLHNATGGQLFWRVYFSLGGDALSFAFSRPPISDVGRWTADKTRIVFVQSSNGPASAELAEVMPGALENPTEALTWKIMFGTEMIRHKGILEWDRFLLRVVKETVIAHPEILGLVAMSATGYLGVNLSGGKLWPLPFWWGPLDTYQAMPYNIDNTVVPHLTPRLLKTYTESQWERTGWLVLLRYAGQNMHNTLRIASGIVLVLTVWFLPLTRCKWLAAYVFLSAGMLIAAGAAGFGYNGRYDHFILPYLLMAAALSTEACVSWFRSIASDKRLGQPR